MLKNTHSGKVFTKDNTFKAGLKTIGHRVVDVKKTGFRNLKLRKNIDCKGKPNRFIRGCLRVTQDGTLCLRRSRAL